MLAKSLFLFGCLPFFVLGALHTIYTIADIRVPKKLVPHDPEVAAMMKSSALALTKETDMWRAWVGFNISHGVGLLFYASAYAYLAIFHFQVLSGSTVLLIGAPLIALIYLTLSKKYWFRIPVLGSLVGLLCLSFGVVATVLANAP
ncbi:MAG TPA: hypothetical protein VF801_03515 [Rhodocyclaceae bacterium]